MNEIEWKKRGVTALSPANETTVSVVASKCGKGLLIVLDTPESEYFPASATRFSISVETLSTLMSCVALALANNDDEVAA